MPRRLPPLTSLRAFEAAGRHLSFTRAAAELAVTQAAISHQVKALEDHLGLHLFLRLPRKLALTESGESLLSTVSSSFDRISAALAEIDQAAFSATLSVRLAPSYAAKWLSPRLGDFRRRFPEIDLRLYHSSEPVNFSRENIDVAVTYGSGDWPGVVAHPVLSLEFFPVCAPSCLEGDYPLTEPDNLRHYTLLHDATRRNWTEWLRLAGLENFSPARGTIMDDTNVLIQAAIDGHGVALGSAIFVADHLEAKRLVKPFDLELNSEYAYYVVCPEAHLKQPAVRAFTDWLLMQTGEQS